MTNASPKQVDYLKSLIAQRDVDNILDVAFIDDLIEANALTSPDASFYIGRAMNAPKRPLAQARMDADMITDAGMYRVDGTIYKVQCAVHGSGRLYAKRLIVGAYGEAHFEYAAGAVRSLKSTDRMTLSEAKEFGVLYGTCCVCGRTLTDEKSIAAGIGPVCAGKV